MHEVCRGALDGVRGGAGTENYDTCMRKVDADLNSGDPARHARGMQRNCFKEFFPNLAKHSPKDIFDALVKRNRQDTRDPAGTSNGL